MKSSITDWVQTVAVVIGIGLNQGVRVLDILDLLAKSVSLDFPNRRPNILRI